LNLEIKTTTNTPDIEHYRAKLLKVREEIINLEETRIDAALRRCDDPRRLELDPASTLRVGCAGQ
jgi:hypothetical protein